MRFYYTIAALGFNNSKLSRIVNNLTELQDDEPPEITYVVENQGKLQAITPTQPMPCQEELDLKFAELVVSLVV